MVAKKLTTGGVTQEIHLPKGYPSALSLPPGFHLLIVQSSSKISELITNEYINSWYNYISRNILIWWSWQLRFTGTDTNPVKKFHHYMSPKFKYLLRILSPYTITSIVTILIRTFCKDTSKTRKTPFRDLCPHIGKLSQWNAFMWTLLLSSPNLQQILKSTKSTMWLLLRIVQCSTHTSTHKNTFLSTLSLRIFFKR